MPNGPTYNFHAEIHSGLVYNAHTHREQVGSRCHAGISENEDHNGQWNSRNMSVVRVVQCSYYIISLPYNRLSRVNENQSWRRWRQSINTWKDAIDWDKNVKYCSRSNNCKVNLWMRTRANTVCTGSAEHRIPTKCMRRRRWRRRRR